MLRGNGLARVHDDRAAEGQRLFINPDVLRARKQRPLFRTAAILRRAVKRGLPALAVSGVGNALLIVGDPIHAPDIAAAEKHPVAGLQVRFVDLRRRAPRGLGRQAVVAVVTVRGHIVARPRNGNLRCGGQDRVAPCIRFGNDLVAKLFLRRFVRKKRGCGRSRSVCGLRCDNRGILCFAVCLRRGAGS